MSELQNSISSNEKNNIEFLHVQSMMDSLPSSMACLATLWSPSIKVASGTG